MKLNLMEAYFLFSEQEAVSFLLIPVFVSLKIQEMGMTSYRTFSIALLALEKSFNPIIIAFYF